MLRIKVYVLTSLNDLGIAKLLLKYHFTYVFTFDTLLLPMQVCLVLS